jgi:hypothetical protein
MRDRSAALTPVSRFELILVSCAPSPAGARALRAAH